MENDGVQWGAGDNAVVIAMAVGDNDGVCGDLMCGIRLATTAIQSMERWDKSLIYIKCSDE